MSKTVDERVVEMRFDNAQFERNIQTSMSTLDKFKQKLDLSGAAKGLNEINNSAKKVDMSGLGSGIESISAKFSAMQVMGVTALANITNSAVNAGKRMVSALTIRPVTDGFKEYETQMNSVQTILANTQKEGTNVKIVNKALDELNAYSDKTIYNFTEMTRNIGTFTAAGVKLDDSVSAIKGIANLAAVSGSNSQQASTAMYQLSQAIASGTVKLMDWNSVVNAGMGGQVFQDALIRTSEHLQTGAKAAIAAEGSFRDSLTTGWLTTDVLTETLDQFSTAADTQEEYEAAVKKFIDQGYTQEEAKQMADMAKTAGDAATKVKTFTQLLDTLKEALGSGWAQSWRLIVGDFEEAKSLWSSASDVLSGFINDTSNARNALLADVFEKGDGRKLLIDSVTNIGESIINVFKAIGSAYRETFDPMTGDDLMNIISGFNKFTESIKFAGEDVDELKRTFKGLLALLDIVTTITGGGLKLALKGLSVILGAFDKDVLDLTANLGDMLVEFRDFLFKNKLIDNGLENVTSGVKMVVKAFADLCDTISEIPTVEEFFENLKNIDLSETGKNVIDGFKNGLKDGITSVPDVLIEIGKSLLNAIKGVLGIHSPSTEMYDVGAYTVEGLANGLKDGSGKILNTMSGIGSKMLEWVKNFDWSKAFALTTSIALLAIVKKMADAMNNITAPLAGVGDVLSGVGEILSKSSESIKKILDNTAKVVKSFSKVIDAKAFQMKSEAIRSIAISLAILAGSVYVLAQLDSGKLWSAVGAITVLSLVLVALSAAMDKLSSASASIDGKSIDLKGLKVSLINIGIALILLAATVKIIGSIDSKQAIQGFFGLAGLVGALTLILASFGTLMKGKSEQNISKAGTVLRKMATTLLLMVGVCKLAGMLSADEMKKGAAFLTAFLSFTIALSGISRIAGKNIDKLGSSLLKISLAMILMTGVCKLSGSLSVEEMKKGAVFATAFLVFVGVLVRITKVGKDSEIVKLGGTLLSVSLAMALMAGACKLVGMLSAEEMLKGAGFALAFLVFIKAIVSITKISNGEQIAKVAGTILAISVAIGIMAGVCALLSRISIQALAKGVTAISILGLILVLMINATKGAGNVKGNIIAISAAIAALAISAAVLSSIDPTKLAGATAAMTILMGMFALIAKASGTLNSAMGSLIAMTAMIGMIGGVVYLLSKSPVESVLGATVSLSVLLLSLSASMLIVSKVGVIAPTALITIGVMTLVVASLAGILYLIKGMNPEAAIGNTKALSLLVLSLSAACAVLTLASLTTPMALATVAVMTLVVTALAGILYLLKDMDPSSALGNATALSTLLLALSASCVILGVAGLMGPAALVGVGVMAGLVVAVGGLMTAIGALVTYFPQLETFLDTGLPILEKIGYGLGSFFGNVVAGFSEGVTSGLPKMATDLSSFMIGLQPFIAGAKQVDESSLRGVTSLVGMIALICGAKLLESVTSWITGSSSISAFSSQLVEFGKAIVQFSNTVKGNIDEGAVTAAASAGKIMAEMATTLPGTGGVIQWFTGDKNMSLFGAQLVSFGNRIVQFSNTVKGNIDEGAVTAAASAGKIMAEIQKSIVPNGGVVQFFTGQQNMENFGEQIVAFGKSLTKFSENTFVDGSAIAAAANAGKMMAELQNAIPEDGWFDDKVSMDDFGKQIEKFGEYLAKYSKKVSGLDNESINSSISPAQRLIGLVKEMSGFEIDSLDAFKNVKDIGAAMQKYSDKVKDIDVGAVSSSVSSAVKLGDLINSLSGIQADGISNFKVTPIGTSMKLYSDSVADIDMSNVQGSISLAKKLVGLINSMSGINKGGVNSFKSAIDTLSKTNVGGITKAFSGSASKLGSIGSNMSNSLAKGFKSNKSAVISSANSMVSAMQKAIIEKAKLFDTSGKLLGTKLAAAIKSKKELVVSAIRSLVNSSSSLLRSYHDSFYNAGSYLVSGFADGINDNSYKSTAKAKAMAKSAYKAAKEALDINSPSKLFRKLGGSVPEGFAQGIDRFGKCVEESSNRMAKNAFNGTENTLSKLAGIINNGIDVQPTIRPVMDLSDVRNGANAISGMFNSNSMIGVTADINAIKSSMSKHSQNGSNDDIVSAINKLRDDLGKFDKPSYTINGVTYDDGSAITSAVESLVRAAKIERRV